MPPALPPLVLLPAPPTCTLSTSPGVTGTRAVTFAPWPPPDGPLSDGGGTAPWPPGPPSAVIVTKQIPAGTVAAAAMKPAVVVEGNKVVVVAAAEPTPSATTLTNAVAAAPTPAPATRSLTP
jgi:hypothetical protein